MSVLDSFWKVPHRERERREGQKKKQDTRKGNVPTNLPGQGELLGQGRVTQQSGFQDFQRMTAPFFSAEKEAFTGN